MIKLYAAIPRTDYNAEKRTANLEYYYVISPELPEIYRALNERCPQSVPIIVEFPSSRGSEDLIADMEKTGCYDVIEVD